MEIICDTFKISVVGSNILHSSDCLRKAVSLSPTFSASLYVVPCFEYNTEHGIHILISSMVTLSLHDTCVLRVANQLKCVGDSETK